jgi:hypothetical protein
MSFDSVKDSGERREFRTGSKRDIAHGKGRYDLIPPYALWRLAKHFENGSTKYGDRNWELGQPLTKAYINSGIRHLQALLAGANDEDHASAVMWNVMCYIETLKRIEEGILPGELDDRPFKDRDVWFPDYLKRQSELPLANNEPKPTKEPLMLDKAFEPGVQPFVFRQTPPTPPTVASQSKNVIYITDLIAARDKHLAEYQRLDEEIATLRYMEEQVNRYNAEYFKNKVTSGIESIPEVSDNKP